jgi:DNA protecting protein DprA
MEIREIIAEYAYFYQGDWNQIADALKKNLAVREKKIKEPYITIFDQAYPDALRKLRYPPWILFYRGNLELLQKPMMTIVGSRELTSYGKENTKLAAEILSKRYVIVSGLAKGADAAAHETALHGGNTIAVIGCGIEQCYPSCNRSLYHEIAGRGLILSEYPSNVGPRKHHFPWRNRILAALGEACIVTQATLHSGTMITVNEALSLSKDIWCFPYPFGEEAGKGCDLLIAQGAGILFDSVQIEDFVPKNGQSGE